MAGSTGCTEGLGLSSVLIYLPSPSPSALLDTPPSPDAIAAASCTGGGLLGGELVATSPSAEPMSGLRLQLRLRLRLRLRLLLLLRATLALSAGAADGCAAAAMLDSKGKRPELSARVLASGGCGPPARASRDSQRPPQACGVAVRALC